MYRYDRVPHLELPDILVDCSSALLDPLLETCLKLELIHDNCSHVWFILDCSMVEEQMIIWMYDYMFRHLCSIVCIVVPS